MTLIYEGIFPIKECILVDGGCFRGIILVPKALCSRGSASNFRRGVLGMGGHNNERLVISGFVSALGSQHPSSSDGVVYDR